MSSAAGAKRTQMFMANYSQKESDRLGLGLRFLTLAPRMMPDTDLGKQAVAGYARYLGVSEGDFIKSMAPPPTSSDVATGVMELLTTPNRRKETVFVVTGRSNVECHDNGGTIRSGRRPAAYKPGV